MATGNFSVPENYDGGLHFAQGQRTTIQAEKSFAVYEPRTGQVVAQCPITSPAKLDEVVRQAAAAQQEWGARTPLERGKLLSRAAELIRANLEAIARAEVRTNGKPIYEARVDIESSADTFSFFGGVAPAVLQGDYLDIPGGATNRFAYTKQEPLGVVGCIGAWNYPFQTACWKIVPALAAGNAVVYKPSPFAPASPVLIGEILAAVGLPAGVYNVVQGEGETGEALCRHELVAKVSFTGSVATGQAVQRNAAVDNVKPVTLELGGKSALVIFDDADLKSAVATAMLANFLNQGQVCTNATRVFVQRGLVDAFVEALKKEADENLVIGDPLDDNTRVGANINELHLNRILGFVESAKQEGGTIVRGGVRVHPTGVENGFFFDPAIVTGLTDEARAVRDEIFGAICLILPFDTEEEVIRRVNNTRYGLASGVFSKDLARAHRVAAQLQAGTIYLNTYNDTEVNVPFGGFKNSGHGRENCLATLRAYSQTKAIYVNLGEQTEHCFGKL